MFPNNPRVLCIIIKMPFNRHLQIRQLMVLLIGHKCITISECIKNVRRVKENETLENE